MDRISDNNKPCTLTKSPSFLNCSHPSIVSSGRRMSILDTGRRPSTSLIDPARRPSIVGCGRKPSIVLNNGRRRSSIDHSRKLSIVEPKKLKARAEDLSASLPSIPDEKQDAEEEKPVLPDGGWGWVVVFSSLMVSLITDGIGFSFGLLYVKFLEEFESSNAETSIIGSVFMSVPLLTGPIMSALVDR